MVMDTLQIRLTKELINELKILVDLGMYSSFSEAVRDSVRRLVTGREAAIKTLPEPVKKIQEKIIKDVKLQRARGTRDIMPENQIIRNKIISTLKETFELFGYSPIETPIIERFELLSSKYAGGAEILKETFKLKDQGGRDLGLRYDLTVPLARFIGMNPQLRTPFKRYQIGEVFRDGPISLGRYRQFIQCDVDVVGCKDMTADAECVNIAFIAFKKLGLDVEIKISNRKILNAIVEKVGVGKNKIEDVLLSIDKLEKFGKEAVIKELKEKEIQDNLIDEIMKTITIIGSNKEKLAKLKKIVKDNEGLKEIEELIDLLNILSIDFVFDVSLARGLSYYTGTVFEIFIKNSKIKTAVCSGGRWDKMIGEFLGKGDYPAVGISFGLDRIYDAFVEKEKPSSKTVTKLYIIPIDTTKKSLKIAQKIRDSGIKTDIDLMSRGISKNLSYANSLGIPFVLFIGEDELKQNKIKLKNMETGKENLLSLKEVIGFLKKESR